MPASIFSTYVRRARLIAAAAIAMALAACGYKGPLYLPPPPPPDAALTTPPPAPNPPASTTTNEHPSAAQPQPVR